MNKMKSRYAKTINGYCPYCGAPVSIGEGTAKRCPSCKKLLHGGHDGSIH